MTYSVGRSGSDSRCCRLNDPALEWIDYVDDGHEEIGVLEQWLTTLPPFARDHELGRIDDLMEAAAQGELSDSGDEVTPIKPVRRDPEIYELRHKALTKKLRFYHGEPAELPEALVAVHRHIKTTDRHQQAQIVYAAGRYDGGRPVRWNSG
jgi:hypothetical protein